MYASEAIFALVSSRFRRRVLSELNSPTVAFGEILVVVQVAVIGRNPIKIPHILGLRALLFRQQGFVHLLPVADADHLDRLLVAAEQLAHGLGLRPDGAGRSLLDEDVAVDALLEGEKHQIHRLVERHDEAGHGRLGQGDGEPLANLLDPERDDRSPGAHHVAVARAADFRPLGIALTALRHGDLLLDGLRDAHGIDRIGRLVGRQTDHRLHAGLDGGRQHVVRTDHVGPDRLHREELARGHLFQRRSMEDIVGAGHGRADALQRPDIADIELDLVGDIGIFGLILVPHIVLFLLVARENADFRDIRAEETPQHRISEATGSTGNHQRFTCKNTHISNLSFFTPFRRPAPPLSIRSESRSPPCRKGHREYR